MSSAAPESAGTFVGVLVTLAATRLLAALLYGVSPADPLTFIATIVSLGTVGLVACYLPARRATTLDPLAVLRSD